MGYRPIVLALVFVACGGASAPTTTPPPTPSTTSSARVEAAATLTLDRSVVSASPVTPGEPPTVKITLAAPAGEGGRHLTLHVDGFPRTFGVDVPAGATVVGFPLAHDLLAKPGTLAIHLDDASAAVKLTVARPAIRLDCPSTVDANKNFELPVVLDAPAPDDGYRVRVSARYTEGPGPRAGAGAAIHELSFAPGATKMVATLRAGNAFELDVHVVDYLDLSDVRERCVVSVRGSTPKPTGGGLL